MRIITVNDLRPIIAEMVQAHPGTDIYSYGRLFTEGGGGSCFVGMILDKLEISPRHMPRVMFQVGSFEVRETQAWFVSEGQLHKYIWDRPSGERITFDSSVELRVKLNESIELNDRGVPWVDIAHKVWGIEVQPDPLAPIPPVKIVTQPPITTKPGTSHYDAAVNYLSKQFELTIPSQSDFKLVG